MTESAGSPTPTGMPISPLMSRIPNLLTYGRIAAVPAVAGLMMYGGDAAQWTALAIFIIAGITDFLDGYLARLWSAQSSLGRMLDPIADKLLVSAVLLILAVIDTLQGIHIWAGIIILCREILVSGLREFLADLRVSVPVTQLAKWKTTIQMVALGFLIAGPTGDKILSITTDIGYTLLWIAAILTLATGWDYLRAGARYLSSNE